MVKMRAEPPVCYNNPATETLKNSNKINADEFIGGTPKYARRLQRHQQGFGDTFFIDEVFVKIDGKQHYLWRAVDQDGEVVDVYLQRRRDGKAAKRFFKRLLKTRRSDT